LDTKGDEVQYLTLHLEKADVEVLLMDVGILGESPIRAQISAREVAKAAGWSLDQLRLVGNEGKALEIMIRGATERALLLYQAGRIQGILSLGGSWGQTWHKHHAFPLSVMIST
jgi:uncharacterized protein (UPF0261 family)